MLRRSKEDIARSAASCSSLVLLLAFGSWWGVSGLMQWDCESRNLTSYLATAAIVVALAAVCWRWLPRRTALVLGVLGSVHLVGWAWWWTLGPEENELEREGDEFVSALASYREGHGRYPASLAEAGCEPRWNRFGGWSYACSADGATWELSVGEYFEDGFVLFRESGDADWSWDG